MAVPVGFDNRIDEAVKTATISQRTAIADAFKTLYADIMREITTMYGEDWLVTKRFQSYWEGRLEDLCRSVCAEIP